MDWKLEVIVVPVSDVDRAKEFYADRLGFHLDVDHRAGDFRVVQLTPPGSGCSISFGPTLNPSEPGTLGGLQLTVDDISRAHRELTERGVDVGELQHFRDGRQQPGKHPDDEDYGTFIFFADPDGNRWAIQQGRRDR